MKHFLLAFAIPLTLAACQQSVDEQANIAFEEANKVTVPADAPAPAPPASEAEVAAATPTFTHIPEALWGRWGLVPADCTSTRGDAKGLLRIDDNRLYFYESRGTLDRIDAASPTSLTANFGFSGEGMEWERRVTLERSEDVLRRREPAVDGEPAVDLRYSACPR